MDFDRKNPRECTNFVRIGAVSNVCFLMNYSCPMSVRKDACLAARHALKAAGLLHDSDTAIAAICCVPETGEKDCVFMQRSKHGSVSTTKSELAIALRRLLEHERPLGETCATIIVDIRTPDRGLPVFVSELKLDPWKRDGAFYRFSDDAEGAYSIDNFYAILEH
jgi:hypothetical protein